jgi:hypothetical protein
MRRSGTRVHAFRWRRTRFIGRFLGGRSGW